MRTDAGALQILAHILPHAVAVITEIPVLVVIKVDSVVGATIIGGPVDHHPGAGARAISHHDLSVVRGAEVGGLTLNSGRTLGGKFHHTPTARHDAARQPAGHGQRLRIHLKPRRGTGRSHGNRSAQETASERENAA